MKTKGFTLLELLITTVIFIGLSLIGITSYSCLVHKNEQSTLVDELQRVIQYAKIQAIILGNPVYLVPLDASLNWSNGLILTTLNQKTEQMDLIYQWQWHHPQWNLNWVGVNSINKIIFSNNPAQAISNGRFILTNKYTKDKVTIILNRLGRLRVTSQ
ncbi:MAG: GspH/FimT family pseudopilin [Legionella longbeachae]|nr:GspH/FimT family pseudopilin [Legionella longbeachae]